MINVILNGSLGNNLFQYALGKHLALKNKTSLKLITYRCINKNNIFAWNRIAPLKSFDIESVSYVSMTNMALIMSLGIQWPFFNNKSYYEKDLYFNPEVLRLKDGIYLNGYFQSEKYFKDVEDIIRSNLQFKNDTLGEQGAIYKEQILGLNSVALHVRRGDYLASPLHNVCNMKYYAKSISYIREKFESPHFFIFSDDLEWCRENFHIPNCSFVEIQAAKNNPVIDLQLMSLCKHNIISNSTFSWWAAWLNGNREKMVIAPNRWLNDERLNEQALQDTVPADWVRIAF